MSSSLRPAHFLFRRTVPSQLSPTHWVDRLYARHLAATPSDRRTLGPRYRDGVLATDLRPGQPSSEGSLPEDRGTQDRTIGKETFPLRFCQLVPAPSPSHPPPGTGPESRGRTSCHLVPCRTASDGATVGPVALGPRPEGSADGRRRPPVADAGRKDPYRLRKTVRLTHRP